MAAFEWLYTIPQLELFCEKVGKNDKILCVQAFVLLLYIRESEKMKGMSKRVCCL